MVLPMSLAVLRAGFVSRNYRKSCLNISIPVDWTHPAGRPPARKGTNVHRGLHFSAWDQQDKRKGGTQTNEGGRVSSSTKTALIWGTARDLRSKGETWSCRRLSGRRDISQGRREQRRRETEQKEAKKNGRLGSAKKRKLEEGRSQSDRTTSQRCLGTVSLHQPLKGLGSYQKR